MTNVLIMSYFFLWNVLKNCEPAKSKDSRAFRVDVPNAGWDLKDNRTRNFDSNSSACGEHKGGIKKSVEENILRVYKKSLEDPLTENAG